MELYLNHFYYKIGVLSFKIVAPLQCVFYFKKAKLVSNMRLDHMEFGMS